MKGAGSRKIYDPNKSGDTRSKNHNRGTLIFFAFDLSQFSVLGSQNGESRTFGVIK